MLNFNMDPGFTVYYFDLCSVFVTNFFLGKEWTFVTLEVTVVTRKHGSH